MKKMLAAAVAAVMTMSASMAMADGAIKIGEIGPLTGAAAIYGTAVANGAQIAIDELNALGGQQYELNAQDDEADAEKDEPTEICCMKKAPPANRKGTDSQRCPKQKGSRGRLSHREAIKASSSHGIPVHEHLTRLNRHRLGDPCHLTNHRRQPYYKGSAQELQ